MQPSYVGPSLQQHSPKRRSAASSRRQSSSYQRLTAAEFDEFVDETALKIKRALNLLPPEPQPELEPQEKDVFDADDSLQEPVCVAWKSTRLSHADLFEAPRFTLPCLLLL
jgi:hypothetical protein